MLTQWFEPEPTSKGLVFARALVRRGHQVEVITGFPNYPGGKIYPGYRVKLTKREEIDGASVLRVPLYPSHDGSALHRAANYLSFAAAASLFGALLTRKPDVIYVYHPPLTVGLTAMVLGAVKRAPFVYDVQDLWPDTLAASGMLHDRRALRVVDWVARWVYRRAGVLVVLSEGFKSALVERGVPASKIEVIHNWCDEDQLQASTSAGAESEPPAERFTVAFAGTMGKAQNLESVLRAAKLLQVTNPDIRFVFVGGGVEAGALEACSREMALGNVRFLPRMPMSEVGGVLAAADVLLVHLKDDPLFEITIPSKTQAYLAAGKPVLMAVRGDAATMIRESGGGVVCRPDDPEDLARVVGDFAAMDPAELRAMGSKGREYYRNHLSLEVGTERFMGVFERLADSSHEGGPG